MPDWKSLFPYESREIAIDGHAYRYLDEGEGEPLFLVHGNPTWSFYWRNLIHAWRGRYRLIVPDHLGCGRSDKPDDYPYTLATRVAHLKTLIERLDLRRVTLLAHDWGGAIGLGAAVESPDRFARLVLFNTAAFRSDRIPWRIRVCRTPWLGTVAVRGLNLFARAAIRMAVAKRERMTPEIQAGLLAPYDSWRNRRAVHEFVKDIPLSPRHPSYAALATVEAGLPKLAGLPCLLLWGMLDWCFTPHFLERFQEFFPQAETVKFDDAGHYVIEDAHERIIPLVEDFFARRPLPT